MFLLIELSKISKAYNFRDNNSLKKFFFLIIDMIYCNRFKGAFVLGENDFKKSFSPKPACLATTKNDIFRKIISG